MRDQDNIVEYIRNKKAMDAANAYGHSGVTITHEAARQASHKPGVEPLPKGRPPALPKDAEAALYEMVLLFRAMKFPLFKPHRASTISSSSSPVIVPVAVRRVCCLCVACCERGVLDE